MTPRQAAAEMYLKTNDLELAFYAGYLAEGRVGKGVAPDTEGARLRQEMGRSNNGRGKSGVTKGRILEALNVRYMTKTDLIKVTPYLSENTLRNAIHRMIKTGEVVSLGWSIERGANFYGITDAGKEWLHRRKEKGEA